MDPITRNVNAFLDFQGIENEGHRKVILIKVQEALSNSATAKAFSKIPEITFYGGPLGDKIKGICLAEIHNIFPEDEKIEFETINGTLILPSYFKGLLERDFSTLFKDPEKAERAKEFTLKKQFHSVTKEAATLYLATRFGTQHLNSIEEVTKEVVFETITKLQVNLHMNDSILSIVKETIQKLDPSIITDIKYLVSLVCALKTRLEIKAEVSQFFKTSLTHSKKYNYFDRFKKWLNNYIPKFLSRALNLLPKHDVKDLINVMIPMGAGIFGIEFPFAVPNMKGILYDLEPIKNRITFLDLSEFNELTPTEMNLLKEFRNLRELKLDKEAKLPKDFIEELKEVKIIYTKKTESTPEVEEEKPKEASPSPKEKKVEEEPKKDASPAPDNSPKEKEASPKSPSGDVSKDGEDAAARDDVKEEAPQSNSVPPAADA